MRRGLPRRRAGGGGRAPPEGLRGAAGQRGADARRARPRADHRVLLPRRRREEAADGRRRHVHREALAARGLPPARRVPPPGARARDRPRGGGRLRPRPLPHRGRPRRPLAQPGPHRGHRGRGVTRRGRAHRRDLGARDDGRRHPAAAGVDLLVRLPRPARRQELHDRRSVHPVDDGPLRRGQGPRGLRRRVDRERHRQALAGARRRLRAHRRPAALPRGGGVRQGAIARRSSAASARTSSTRSSARPTRAAIRTGTRAPTRSTTR